MMAFGTTAWAVLFGVAGVVLIGIVVAMRIRGRKQE